MGRVAAVFLIMSNLDLLLAPLFFLLDLTRYVNPGEAPGGALLALFSDPTRLLAIGDLLAMIGIILLALALFLILFGLFRGERRVPLDTFLLGILALACLVAWVPVMLYAQGRARGTLGTVDAVAATGGWSLASFLLLGAALAFFSFTLLLDKGPNGAKPLRLTSFKWPIYAAVNVLGSAAIAGFFLGASTGAGNVDAFSLGLALKVTLIPVLGIMAYRDMKDRFPVWEQVPILQPPKEESVAEAVPGTEVVRPSALPLPPPPDD